MNNRIDENKREIEELNSRIAQLESENQQLYESRKFFESMMNNDKISFVIVQGIPPRVVFVNRGCAILTGYSADEILSMEESEIRSLILPEYRDEFFRRYYRRSRGEAVEDEYQIMAETRNGFKIIRFFVYPIDFSGESSVLILLVDETGKAAAENALRESEEYYRLLFNRSPAGIFYYDSDLIITECNDRFIDLLKSTREKLIGLDMNVLQDGRVLPCIKTALNGVEGIYEGPYSATTGDADIVISMRTEPLVSETGEVRGGGGIVEDITRRFKVEEALEQSERRFKEMVDNSPSPLAVVDCFDNLVYVNSSFVHLFGYDKDEIGNLSSWWTIAYPDESYRKNVLRHWEREYSRVKKTGEIRGPGEFRVSCRDNTVRNIEFHLMPVGEQIVILMNDLTEYRIAEEELVKARKIESLGILAGGIAHDFNNILTSVVGNLSFAKEVLDDRDQLLEILSIAENASIRGKELTRQLLTFSRGGTPVCKSTSIIRLLKETADFVLSGSDVMCDFNIESDLRAADIDSGQISQVFQNLIINAVEAMPAGGVINVTAENYSAAENDPNLSPGNYVRIVFSDKGKGIPGDIITSVFDPFFTTKKSGSGLGLSVTYSIIKKHRGYIRVRSNCEEGTVFELFLPASGSSEKFSSVSVNGYVFEGRRVLVMDDEELILKTSRRMLEMKKFIVDTALTGEEAVAKFNDAQTAGKSFDLVILDLTIPGGIGGREVISILKKNDPAVKAIVSSGYSSDPVMSNYSDYGFAGVVTKPYSFDDFFSVVVHVLDE